MGRELKRVPMDFDYPLNTVWEGYCPTIETFQKLFGEKYPFLCKYNHCGQICEKCEINCGECSESAEYCLWHNEANKSKWHIEVPEGEGYQLWETTSEGSPVSPVFSKLDELCEWCEDNATTFGSCKASKEQWKQMLDNNFVYHQQGNAIFI